MLIRSMLMVAALVIATSPLLADEAAVLSAPDEASIRDLESRSWVAWQNHDAAFFEGWSREYAMAVASSTAIHSGRSPLRGLEPIRCS
jgi:hypothetical protein